jgi:hypothetical protein
VEAARKQFIKSFLLLLLFYSGCFLFFLALRIINASVFFPDEKSFLNWDAMHYLIIRDHGYKTGMVAFFPLFPLLWKITLTGSIGISILNGFIFLFSFSWLAGVFEIAPRRLLLLASVPSFIFMFLPLSESLFFLTCTIFLAGLKNKNQSLQFLGLILAGLTRPVATVFIPAFIILHYLSEGNSKSDLMRTVKMIVASVAVLLLVFIIQYLQTGEWFSFFRVQKDWGNYFRLPLFPLNSWAGGFILRLDAIAFFTGTCAGILLLYFIIRKIKSGQSSKDDSFVFSICYLSLMIAIVLFTRGGILNSLNRYIFCTAFFTIALNAVLTLKIFNGKNLLILFLTSGIFWLLFGSYVHIQTLLKFMLLTLYLVMLFCITTENRFWKNVSYYGVLTTNIIFMAIFFERFLSGEWVG